MPVMGFDLTVHLTLVFPSFENGHQNVLEYLAGHLGIVDKENLVSHQRSPLLRQPDRNEDLRCRRRAEFPSCNRHRAWKFEGGVFSPQEPSINCLIVL